jgi:hypothetical protein
MGISRCANEPRRRTWRFPRSHCLALTIRVSCNNLPWARLSGLRRADEAVLASTKLRRLPPRTSEPVLRPDPSVESTVTAALVAVSPNILHDVRVLVAATLHSKILPT